MTDTQLSDAYESTDFWVDDVPGGPFSFRCGERCERLERLLLRHDLRDWVFITACNPGSRRLSPEKNDCRTRALEAQLPGRPCVIYRGRGVGTVGEWPPEASFLVLGIDHAAGLRLGEEFGQNAIVVGSCGEPARLAWIAGQEKGTL